MSQPHLYTLLSGIKKEEVGALKQFVRSPVHYGQSHEYPLLQAILKLTRNLEKKDWPSEERVWRAMYGADSALKPGGLRKMQSGLAATVRQFMAWKAWQQDKGAAERYLFTALNDRGLYDQVQPRLDRSIEALESEPAVG